MSKSSHHEARTSLLASEPSGFGYPPSAYRRSPSMSMGKYESDGDYGSTQYGRGYAAELETTHVAPGGYAQREGLVAGSPGLNKKSAGASSWRWWPSSRWQWIFVGVVVGQAVAGLALESYIFGSFQANIIDGEDIGSFAGGKTVTVYLSLFIFGYIYQLLLTYDAMRMKNTIQLIGICIYNFGLMVEAAMESDQIYDALVALDQKGGAVDPNYWHHIEGFIIAVPCVMVLGTVCMGIATWKLYAEFSWTIYKDISADLRLKRRFLAYQIYIALLKFDFFFFLAFTMEFLVAVGDNPDVEKWLTVAAIPVTIVLLFLAALWVHQESLFGMICTIGVYFGGMAYFVFKLVRMFAGPPDRILQYLPARRSLTTFAVITILLLAVTIVYAIMCTYNFNKGLKGHIGRRGRSRRSPAVDMNNLFSGDHGEAMLVGQSGPSRITID